MKCSGKYLKKKQMVSSKRNSNNINFVNEKIKNNINNNHKNTHNLNQNNYPIPEIKIIKEKKEEIISQYLSFKTILTINQSCNLISVFPLGNIICAKENFLLIFDFNFKIIQHILAHDNDLFCISIKDDNNFVTSSYDDTIKIWKKIKNKFILYYTIINGHNSWIYNVLYCPNYNIISCSHDHSIKIWIKNKSKYECMMGIKTKGSNDSTLLLNDINILIISGGGGTMFWNINNYELLFSIYIFCCGQKILKRLNKEKIIIGADLDSKIKIVDIISRKEIMAIDNGFKCNGICVLPNRNLFMVGGTSHNIKLYNSENYEYIGNFSDSNNGHILGLILFKNDLILSYANVIVLWSISN